MKKVISVIVALFLCLSFAGCNKTYDLKAMYENGPVGTAVPDVDKPSFLRSFCLDSVFKEKYNASLSTYTVRDIFTINNEKHCLVGDGTVILLSYDNNGTRYKLPIMIMQKFTGVLDQENENYLKEGFFYDDTAISYFSQPFIISSKNTYRYCSSAYYDPCVVEFLELIYIYLSSDGKKSPAEAYIRKYGETGKNEELYNYIASTRENLINYCRNVIKL